MAMMLPDEPQKPGGYINPRGLTPGDPWAYRTGGAAVDPSSMMGMMGALKSAIGGGAYPPPPASPVRVGGSGRSDSGRMPVRRQKTLAEQIKELDALIADAQQRLYAAMELAVSTNNPYAKGQADSLNRKIADLNMKREELVEKLEEQQAKEEERMEEERQRKEASRLGSGGPSARTQGPGSSPPRMGLFEARSQGLTSWGSPRTQYGGG